MLDTSKQNPISVEHWKSLISNNQSKLSPEKLHNLRVEFRALHPQSFDAHLQLAKSYLARKQAKQALQIANGSDQLLNMTPARYFANDKLKLECLKAMGAKKQAVKFIDNCLQSERYIENLDASRYWLINASKISFELSFRKKGQQYLEKLKQITLQESGLAQDVREQLCSIKIEAPRSSQYANLAWKISGHEGDISTAWLKDQNWGVEARKIFKNCCILPQSDERHHIFKEFIADFDTKIIERSLNKGQGTIITGSHLGWVHFIYYAISQSFPEAVFLGGEGILNNQLEVVETGSNFKLAKTLMQYVKSGKLIVAVTDGQRNTLTNKSVNIDGYELNVDTLAVRLAYKTGAPLLWIESHLKDNYVHINCKSISPPKTAKSSTDWENWYVKSVARRFKSYHKKYEVKNFNLPANYVRALQSA